MYLLRSKVILVRYASGCGGSFRRSHSVVWIFGSLWSFVVTGESESEVVAYSAKRWDCRYRADLIESATPCHDAQVVGPYWVSSPFRLAVLAAKSEDYTTAPQRLQQVYDCDSIYPCMTVSFCHFSGLQRRFLKSLLQR